MRSQLKSQSKRKWIIGGAMLFGGLALLTTGFATWIIGVNIDKSNHKTDVTVDTTTNSSLILKMTASELKVHVGENYEDSSARVHTENGNTDFAITFSSVTIEASKAFLDANTISGISFAFSTGDAAKESANAANTLTGNANFGREASKSYTYLDIAEESKIDIAKGAATTAGNITTYKWENLSVTLFKWGSFFGNVSPCTFYNASARDSYFEDVSGATNAESELNALEAAFNGKTLAVTATVDYAAKGA